MNYYKIQSSLIMKIFEYIISFTDIFKIKFAIALANHNKNFKRVLTALT